jgi:2-polyprenyl-6-methoxyphenol hydroxylase-like FAD-dependent oxidoreductase
MPIQDLKQKIAIAGAGICGAYLHKLLHNEGIESDVYDIGSRNRCGLSPCAWGTSRGFTELVEAAGLDADSYILGRVDHILMDEVKITADLMTFDKPGLIKDLLEGVRINHAPLDVAAYDRVVDATGVFRAYLPILEQDLLLRCVQWRLEAAEILENRIDLGQIGYAWSFPLFTAGYHVGCGSLTCNPRARMKEIGWLKNIATGNDNRIICQCAGAVRLTGPRSSQPFVVDGIWGVGEAIGCVAPLAGDGVVPGMKSVRLLLNHWDDPDKYTEAVLKEFQWMESERRVIDKLRKKRHLGIQDALVLKRNSKRMGMQIKIGDAAKLIKRLR